MSDRGAHGDGISIRLQRRTERARVLAVRICSAKRRKPAIRRAEREFEEILVEARLLWSVRQKMVEMVPLVTSHVSAGHQSLER